MESETGLDRLLEMQEQLMGKVPHGLRSDVYPKAQIALRLFERVLQYLGACGHKPWRPNPLAIEVQMEYLTEAIKAMTMLAAPIEQAREWIRDEYIKSYDERELVAALGVVEEVIEYTNAFNSNRKEEITDILFFYLELVILGGFTWQQIEEEYVRKHAENLERYKKAGEGDFSWDKRGEGGL